MIASILVPVDRSAEAEAGLEWASHAAQRSGAAMHILSVVHPDAPEAADAAEAYVHEKSLATSAAGIATSYEVAAGSPAEVILARAPSSELTVMTHRAGRWDFGGNLATVLREMRQPVLVVRPGAAEPETGLERPTILVPLDQPAFSRCVLDTVGMLANGLQFRVVLCRVIKPYGPYMDPSQAPPAIAAEIRDQIDSARRDLEWNARELPVPKAPEVVIAMGDPSREIVRAAVACQAGLIAMATPGSHNLSRIMGSTAHAVLQATRVPCLLVRPPDAPSSSDLDNGATASRVA